MARPLGGVQALAVLLLLAAVPCLQAANLHLAHSFFGTAKRNLLAQKSPSPSPSPTPTYLSGWSASSPTSIPGYTISGVSAQQPNPYYYAGQNATYFLYRVATATSITGTAQQRCGNCDDSCLISADQPQALSHWILELDPVCNGKVSSPSGGAWVITDLTTGATGFKWEPTNANPGTVLSFLIRITGNFTGARALTYPYSVKGATRYYQSDVPAPDTTTVKSSSGNDNSNVLTTQCPSCTTCKTIDGYGENVQSCRLPYVLGGIIKNEDICNNSIQSTPVYANSDSSSERAIGTLITFRTSAGWLIATVRLDCPWLAWFSYNGKLPSSSVDGVSATFDGNPNSTTGFARRRRSLHAQADTTTDICPSLTTDGTILYGRGNSQYQNGRPDPRSTLGIWYKGARGTAFEVVPMYRYQNNGDGSNNNEDNGGDGDYRED
ncbi:hypothetical protein HYH03_004924 [Edaphochlamys debaryana]|uniref:Uncharacterized protein n=1 Tax=Edaphochlamys debaryana TaxID=47281 RepID=A0A836C2P1_9CHLO|nr:hypothetical protein HYH03_004924 [Edaphochlamys debaryana]|eukprot:KAG2496918.1 hypothetical protein HYH03_004924 [Edaphochlamys debaryana]